MKILRTILITVAISLVVSVFVVSVVQSVQNKAIAYEEQIYTAQSELAVQEKRRADLIPNLVDCVKAYDQHEYEIIMGVINARGASSDDVSNEIQLIINTIAEVYPELKSSENYRELMNELTATESLIADYRNKYNNWVKQYKQHIRKFPNSQILDLLGYEPKDYFYLDYITYESAPTNLFGNK